MVDVVYCRARDCHEIAFEYTQSTQTGEIEWATCARHKRWVRPYVSEGESRSSVSAGLIHAQIKVSVDLRLRLAGKKLPALVISEIAYDVMADVFGNPNMRVLVADVLDQHETGANG